MGCKVTELPMWKQSNWSGAGRSWGFWQGQIPSIKLPFFVDLGPDHVTSRPTSKISECFSSWRSSTDFSTCLQKEISSRQAKLTPWKQSDNNRTETLSRCSEARGGGHIIMPCKFQRLHSLLPLNEWPAEQAALWKRDARKKPEKAGVLLLRISQHPLLGLWDHG